MEQMGSWVSARAGAWAGRHPDVVTTKGSAPRSQPEALRSQGDEDTALLPLQEDDKDEVRLRQ